MANTLDPMDIKQIITLHLEGTSNRQIGTTLGISRNTVNTYIQFINECSTAPEELLKMETHKLRELFTSGTTVKNKRYDELMRYFAKVNEARSHPGFTFLYHYEEYKQEAEEPYSYTQFMEHYNRRYAEIKGSMKLEHKAGYEMFVDYTGKKLSITDKETGEAREAEVFVAILPYSQYTYVEACMSQKREDLINCMQNALRFYGGVPKAIVSDNLKSAVTRASKYEAEINRSLKDFALHCGCAVNPTRSYSPQDKALVENAVNLAYQRIYYPLRQMQFFSLADLNRHIKEYLGRYNSLLLQRKQASRLELFQSTERSLLRPLPASPYELKGYARAKVQKIGYVYFSPDKSYYSVPYRYIGKSTQIHYTRSTVEVYYANERIALHFRKGGKGTYTTEKDHLSSSCRQYSEWSPEYFRRKAKPLGINVLACADSILARADYPETAYKRILGIISLAKSYGKERLDSACQRAMYGRSPSYRMIKNILENGTDKEQLGYGETGASGTHIPAHENIRGASNYN